MRSAYVTSEIAPDHLREKLLTLLFVTIMTDIIYIRKKTEVRKVHKPVN